MQNNLRPSSNMPQIMSHTAPRCASPRPLAHAHVLPRRACRQGSQRSSASMICHMHCSAHAHVCTDHMTHEDLTVGVAWCSRDLQPSTSSLQQRACMAMLLACNAALLARTWACCTETGNFTQGLQSYRLRHILNELCIHKGTFVEFGFPHIEGSNTEA